MQVRWTSGGSNHVRVAAIDCIITLSTLQVLAKRTHPQIMMDGCGGYLLTGIKVNYEELPKGNESETKRTRVDQQEEDKTEEKDTSESATKRTRVDQVEVVKTEEKDTSESATKKMNVDQEEI